MICIPLTTKTETDSLAAIDAANKHADIIEIRLDYLDDPNCAQKLIKHSTVPIIATWRKIEDGGCNDCNDNIRLQWLQKAANWGANYIDVELEYADEFPPQSNTKIIVSHHDFKGFPNDFETILENIRKHPLCDIAKIAVKIDKIQDNLRIFQALKTSKKETIALGMGELGLISRIATKKFGGYLTFASLTKGTESAPGQITASELRNRFRYDKINTDTKIYGIIANPVGHSMSPDIHNAAFDKLNLNCLYLPFKVDGEPNAFIEDFKQIPVYGYSVTIPHKESVQKSLSQIEPLAQQIGAVNTIVMQKNNELHGYNSDCWAAINAVENKINLTDKNCLIIGAGGAARAIAFGLQSRQANISICNRTFEKAQNLAKECNGLAITQAEVQSIKWDVILNTTSVGMSPNTDETPFDKNGFTPNCVVFDAIYNPLETKLLKEANSKQAKTINGVEMFIAQGARQFELWTGAKAPKDIMQNVMLAKLKN